MNDDADWKDKVFGIETPIDDEQFFCRHIVISDSGMEMKTVDPKDIKHFRVNVRRGANFPMFHTEAELSLLRQASNDKSRGAR